MHPNRAATAPARDQQFSQRRRKGAGGEAGSQQRGAGRGLFSRRCMTGFQQQADMADTSEFYTPAFNQAFGVLFVRVQHRRRNISFVHYQRHSYRPPNASPRRVFHLEWRAIAFRFVFLRHSQGTAADIVKTAMVLVARRLDAWRGDLEEGLDCPRLIMQASTAQSWVSTSLMSNLFARIAGVVRVLSIFMSSPRRLSFAMRHDLSSQSVLRSAVYPCLHV